MEPPVNNSPEYDSSNDDSLSESELLMASASRQSARRKAITSWRKILPWVFHLILFSTSAAFFLSGFSMRYTLKAADRPAVVTRFDGTFNRSSTFKGPPSTAVDEAWMKIMPTGVIRIPEDVFQTLNSSKHAVKVPAEAGGGRMAIFEAIHLIHCVKTLWQVTYPDFYKDEYEYSQEHPGRWHEHMDHCADMLRQKLMCDADRTLITYNWVRGHYKPHPNFNVEHKCNNYDSLLEDSRRLRLDGRQLVKGYVSRPLGEAVAEFDEPPFDPWADS